MRPILPVLLILLGLLLESCCSCNSTKCETGEVGGSAETSSLPKLTQPAAIKQNVSLIEAVIDSVIHIDDTRFTLSLTVRSTREIEEDLPSLAEPGQKITVTPEFLPGGEKEIDLKDDRNRRLLALRSATSGTLVRGRVSLIAPGRWILADIEP